MGSGMRLAQSFYWTYSDKVVELHGYGWPLITFCVCLLSWQPTYKTVEDGVFVHVMHFELFFHN